MNDNMKEIKEKTLRTENMDLIKELIDLKDKLSKISQEIGELKQINIELMKEK